MSLKFEKNEDAIFVGVEAEGRHKGLPTLFIVGNPLSSFILKALATMQRQYPNGYSIYIGAGSNIEQPLTPSNLELVLAQFMFADVSKIFKLTIESTFEHMVDNMIKYAKVLDDWKVFPMYKDWVIPLLWMSKDKFISLTDSNHLQMFMSKDCIAYMCGGFAIYGKVYVEDLTLFVMPLETCHFSDYDNNVAEYITDKLIYSSVKGRM